MGLSSSQGRLLMLTSRMSDISYQEILLTHRRNQLTWESENTASEYSKAMNNMKMTVKVDDESASGGYRKEDINYNNLSSMGYLPIGPDEQVYLTKDENGNWIIPKDLDGKYLLSIDETTGKAIINNKEYDIEDGSRFLKEPDKFQSLLFNGIVGLADTNNNTVGIFAEVKSADTKLECVRDTSDDAAAESKYDHEKASIARKENLLDTELAQLETEYQVVSQEYESIKSLIKSNIDRTYNLFSG